MPMKHGYAQRGKKMPEYNIWISMKERSKNPNHEHFAEYGGRGISVCSAWINNFARFLSDVGPRPSPLHSIDRFPNNDGNYEASNVRWATKTEQAENRRKRRKCPRIVFEGRSLAEVARERGLSPATVFKKWRRGVRGEGLFVDGRTASNKKRHGIPRHDLERDSETGKFKKRMDGTVVLR